MSKSRYKIINVISLLCFLWFFLVEHVNGKCRERRRSNLLGQQNSITSNWTIEKSKTKNSWDRRIRCSLGTYFDEPFGGSFFRLLLPRKCTARIWGCWHKTTAVLNETIKRGKINAETLEWRLWDIWKVNCFRLVVVLRLRNITFESRHLLTHWCVGRCRDWVIQRRGR